MKTLSDTPRPLLSKTRLQLVLGLLGLSVLTSTALFLQPNLAKAQAPEPASVQATDQIILTAIPPRLGDNFELSGAPGDILQTSIRVVNESNQPVTITSTKEDFIVDETGRTPIPITTEIDTRWSLANWMTISPTTQTLQPKEIGTLNIIINVPDDALPGGKYAMITHAPQVATTSGPAQSQINQRVGTLVYFLVEGPVNEEAFVRDFEFPDFTEYGPVPFSYTIDNASDLHIQARTKIEISNMFGQVVDTITTEQTNIFPFVPREIDGEWDRKWGIGYYRATLTMSYGSQSSLVITHANFWLLPIRLILLVLLITLVLLALLETLRRRLKQKSTATKQRISALEKELQRRTH